MSDRDLRRLDTARLCCEALAPEHATELRSLLSDPLVAATLSPTGRPPAPGASPEELELTAAHWRQHGFGLWLLRDRATGAMVGRGGLQHTVIEGADEVEIAWAIVPGRWREGLATELALACIEVAFEHLAMLHVIAYTRTDNIASRGVMERAGMSLEREFIDRWGLRSVLYRCRNAEKFRPRALKLTAHPALGCCFPYIGRQTTAGPQLQSGSATAKRVRNCKAGPPAPLLR
ncbi:MAG: GNAT family N-acetyltransferase [Solirubrobacteraceae bacterium]